MVRLVQETTVTADSDTVRTMMSTFPCGVTVVTTTDPDTGEHRGMTCTAMSSVSLSPPILLTCVHHTSRTGKTMLRSGRFAVNLLRSQSVEVAQRFASHSGDPFGGLQVGHADSLGGPHLIEDAHYIADCRVTEAVPMGDHLVFFGAIFNVATEHPHDADPLLYGYRQYWQLSEINHGNQRSPRP